MRQQVILIHKSMLIFNCNFKEQLTDPSMFTKDSELTLKRSNSATSISSHVESNNENQQLHIRLCSDCIRLLNKKYQSLKDKSNRPKIFSLYDVIIIILHLF